MHARGSPERTPVPSWQRPLRTQKEAVFTPTPAGEPAPLPSTGPPGAGRPHMGDAQGRQGDPQHWGPAADCPQSLHVLKREINAGERVQGSFQF